LHQTISVMTFSVTEQTLWVCPRGWLRKWDVLSQREILPRIKLRKPKSYFVYYKVYTGQSRGKISAVKVQTILEATLKLITS